ncbi:putative nuclease HARBI1 [Mya arenaria]|uniref:putative nuclease HARBI1 n=1 Tax=Mya arenaria TaxID=6604 RepID=UPI0022E5AAF4|nr:putative nuclease HARBI1 [Mya arenaria]
MAALIGAQNVNIRKKRVYRPNFVYKTLTDKELRAKYRFGKEGLQFLNDQLEERLRRPTGKGCAMDPAEQVCIALRYYATGAFFDVVGDTMGRDKATVCRVVKHVTEGLVEMKDRFIRWPTRMDTRRNIMAGFADVAGIPNVIGAIDGSHVEITKPGPTEERPFINRKGRASINVMAVCDNKDVG